MERSYPNQKDHFESALIQTLVGRMVMRYFSEGYHFYYCIASCLEPHEGHRKYDLIEYRYAKPFKVMDIDTSFKLGMAMMMGIPYEEAAKELGIG